MMKVVQSIRLAQNPPPLLIVSAAFQGGGGRRRVRFVQSQHPRTASDQEGLMEKKKPMDVDMDQINHDDKTGDVMSHSFGEGYATRSDEEGFGGIYASHSPTNQSLKSIDESHPDYDRKQGSQVSETEQGRNQKKESSHN